MIAGIIFGFDIVLRWGTDGNFFYHLHTAGKAKGPNSGTIKRFSYYILRSVRFDEIFSSTEFSTFFRIYLCILGRTKFFFKFPMPHRISFQIMHFMCGLCNSSSNISLLVYFDVWPIVFICTSMDKGLS